MWMEFVYCLKYIFHCKIFFFKSRVFCWNQNVRRMEPLNYQRLDVTISEIKHRFLVDWRVIQRVVAIFVIPQQRCIDLHHLVLHFVSISNSALSGSLPSSDFSHASILLAGARCHFTVCGVVKTQFGRAKKRSLRWQMPTMTWHNERASVICGCNSTEHTHQRNTYSCTVIYRVSCFFCFFFRSHTGSFRVKISLKKGP